MYHFYGILHNPQQIVWQTKEANNSSSVRKINLSGKETEFDLPINKQVISEDCLH